MDDRSSSFGYWGVPSISVLYTSTGAGSSRRQEADEDNSRPQTHARPKNRYVQICDAAQGLETPVSSGGGAGVAS